MRGTFQANLFASVLNLSFISRVLLLIFEVVNILSGLSAGTYTCIWYSQPEFTKCVHAMKRDCVPGKVECLLLWCCLFLVTLVDLP
ncbi:hypothetical protein F5Y18DRAFT_165981 [Xylariaceae sp. FL1019]|nr:hypothetical protein F5Y18DRAFT_165981 [Xylariaceae sp. FL1019]